MFNESKIKFSKDLLRKFIVSLIIFMVVILNGFLSFMTLGGLDFSLFLTSTFWLNYTLLILSEIIILLCVYIFRKNRNLKEKEIQDLSNEIYEYRKKIYKLNLPKSVAEWLRNFYNPREKINLFEDKLLSIQEKLNFDEPFKVDSKDKKAYKLYLKKKKLYEKNLKTYNWVIEQLNLIKLYRKKLEFLKSLIIENSKFDKNTDEKLIFEYQQEISKIEKELNEKNFAYRNFKTKYENVYWDTLTSNEYELNSTQKPSAQFHEKRIVANKLWSKVLLGLTFTFIFSAMLPPIITGFTWDTVVNLLLKFILFLLSAFSGIILGDTSILYYYKSALTVRKTIFNEVNYDLGISKIEIEERKKEG